jgi:ATP-dependent Clp protease ATP-binding subunit ClpA
MVMPTRLSADVREEVLRAAIAEARRRGDRHLGTEHLLLGLLEVPGGFGERAMGVSVTQAREALVASDAQALETIGVDPGLATADPSGFGGRRLSWSNGAKRTLSRAVTEAKDRGESRISARSLLVALLAAEPPDAAADLVRFMQLDVAAIRTSLRQTGEGVE